VGRVKLLIADDHPVVRKGLQEIFGMENDIELVGEAQDGPEIVAKAKELEAQVVLMDLKLPKMDGIWATREIKKLSPEIKIIILTSYQIDEDILASIEAGADGYLLKDTPAAEIVKAVLTVHSGESFLHPLVTKKVLGEVRAGLKKEDAFGLTARELEVLQHMARGCKNQEIATELWISETTVKAHVSRILQKLGTADRLQAIVKASQQKLVDLREQNI